MPTKSETIVRLADYFDSCSTRERARRFFPTLLKHLETAPPADRLVLSFDGVEFVSPSFLDEILVRLAQERPALLRRLCVKGLSSFATRRLRSILDHRDLLGTLQHALPTPALR